MRALDRFLERPRVYRLWQRAAFAEAKIAPVLEILGDGPVGRVLDLGCGPGTNARHFRGADYLGVDLNPRYIEAARRRHPEGEFRVGDAAALDLPGRTFDLVLVNSLLHHLDDNAADRALAGARARLAPGGRIHVLDLVLPPRASVARRLAGWDRGDHPRPLEAWRELFARRFETVRFRPYALGAGLPLWHMVHFEGKIPSP